ncbi:MAG TPA: NUDIX hydrolase [Phycisphaerae bacterium]|nr:NUDIX hydrolase [Phycisphaerae bacterium]
MHRRALLQKLSQYSAIDAADASNRDRIAHFVSENEDCFERSLLIGHVTGSGWLVNPPRERVLLTHHRKLNKWLQLGGHADGDADVLRVALREAEEESGLTGIVALSDGIFDLDVHLIPEREGVPEHVHYDVRFLLQADGDDFVTSAESHELRWFTAAELSAMPIGRSVLRMQSKWHAFLAGNAPFFRCETAGP